MINPYHETYLSEFKVYFKTTMKGSKLTSPNMERSLWQ